MKVGLVGVAGVPLGKHKVKDPRLDQADKLVKADHKTYALVDVVGEEEASTADTIVASPEARFGHRKRAQLGFGCALGPLRST